MKKPLIIFLVLSSISVLIVLLHFLLHPIRLLDMDTSLFYLDEKVTLGAYFHTILTAILSFTILTTAGLQKNPLRKMAFVGMGIFFGLLSIDEYFELHEYANTLVKASLESGTLSDLAQQTWIYPFAVGIALVFFLLALNVVMEKQTKVQLPYIAGIICYCAVLILEIVGGQAYGQNSYVTYVGLEEGFEMLGGSLFLWGVLEKIASEKG